jgi:hypothetical protein
MVLPNNLLLFKFIYLNKMHGKLMCIYYGNGKAPTQRRLNQGILSTI